MTWRGRQGWANLRYIGEGDEGDGAIGGGVVTGCVVNVALNDVLNMRSRPTASSRIVSYLRPSECGVRVLSTRGRWVRVNSGGATGWVNGRYFNY
ncbi:MAG: SH3 domain-containing protein [Pseudomonadota bacterium]